MRGPPSPTAFCRRRRGTAWPCGGPAADRRAGSGGPPRAGALDRLDGDPALVVRVVAGGAFHRGGEAGGGVAGNLEQRSRSAAMRIAPISFRVMWPAAAQQRQQPARIGILAAADVHPEPDHVLEAGPVDRPGGRQLPRLGVFSISSSGCGMRGAVRADQRGGDVLGAALGEQARGQLAVLLVDLDRREQGREQALAVAAGECPRASAARSTRPRSALRAASIRPACGADRARSGPRCPSCPRGRCGRSGAAGSRRRAAARHGRPGSASAGRCRARRRRSRRRRGRGGRAAPAAPGCARSG